MLTTGTGEIFLASTATGTSTLSFNDQGKGQTFTLAAGSAGADSVVMSIGGNRIIGVNGDETLINGVNSTIVGQGVISNFAQFVNNGALQTGGGVLEVQAPLGNWNGATGTLTGGTYIADGGVLKLDSLGSQTITNLTGANVTIQGAGAITGSGTVNALGGLANVTNSSILLDSASALTITPGWRRAYPDKFRSDRARRQPGNQRKRFGKCPVHSFDTEWRQRLHQRRRSSRMPRRRSTSATPPASPLPISSTTARSLSMPPARRHSKAWSPTRAM